LSIIKIKVFLSRHIFTKPKGKSSEGDQRLSQKQEIWYVTFDHMKQMDLSFKISYSSNIPEDALH